MYTCLHDYSRALLFFTVVSDVFVGPNVHLLDTHTHTHHVNYHTTHTHEFTHTHTLSTTVLS